VKEGDTDTALDYKSEDNPEEDETWIQREIIQVWILMAHLG